MTDQVSQRELELEAELKASEEVVATAQAEFDAAEQEYQRLQKKRLASQQLEQLSTHFVELSQLEGLTEKSPITGEALASENAVNQHYSELVERVNEQVKQFKEEYAAAEERYNSAHQALNTAKVSVNQISEELQLARPMVQARTIVRKGSDGVERPYVVIFRRQPIMPWAESARDERRYKKAVIRITLLMLLLCLILPFIPVPEPERIEVIEIPERVAQLIQERAIPPPPPPPRKSKEKPKELAKNKKPSPEQKAPKAKKQVAKAARDKAQRSGLLAFSDSFADLMNNNAERNLGKQARVTSGGDTARRTERSLITSAAGRASSGINTAALSRDVAGSGLEGRGTSRVTGVIGDEFGDAERPLANSIKGSRTDEEIQLVFDKNKSALYAIYQRALRKDPTLKGKVILKITISPEGKVTASAVVSSDLNNTELERKIAARVRLFNFGPKEVDAITINYPIDFLPA